VNRHVASVAAIGFFALLLVGTSKPRASRVTGGFLRMAALESFLDVLRRDVFDTATLYYLWGTRRISRGSSRSQKPGA
jgi:hypothetical protein